MSDICIVGQQASSCFVNLFCEIYDGPMLKLLVYDDISWVCKRKRFRVQLPCTKKGWVLRSSSNHLLVAGIFPNGIHNTRK